MKVLLINGSPHEHGCVFTSLGEVGKALTKDDVRHEIFWIGNKPVQGCIGCGKCKNSIAPAGCIFKDELYFNLTHKLNECDAVVIGAPVYYAAPPGSLCAILDRVFYSASSLLKYKVGACVVNCRRGGASSTYDRLNKYFAILQMPIATSQYWNSTHGTTPDEVAKDTEGLQTMRTLGHNISFLLKNIVRGAIARPEPENPERTNFIR